MQRLPCTGTSKARGRIGESLNACTASNRSWAPRSRSRPAATSTSTRGYFAANPVFEWLRYVDATFSTFRADSAISRGDHRDPEVREVLARCEALREFTGGAFDGDPMGYVKGWAAERAAAMIEG